MRPIFHDEYTGPRWTYGLALRPIAPGAQPKGFIIGSQSPHSGFAFGAIDYPRHLTTQEMNAYELKEVRYTPAPTYALPFNENDCGGVFDGHGVVSDADPGL